MVVKDTPSTHLCVSLSQQGRSIEGLLPSELDPLDNRLLQQAVCYLTYHASPRETR